MGYTNFFLLIGILVLLIVLYRLLPKKSNQEFSKEFSNFDFGSDLTEQDLVLEIFSSSNENAILNFLIVLDANDIKYSTTHSVFHDLYPGPYIWGYNVARIYVKEKDFEAAWKLLTEYKKTISQSESSPSIKNRIRNVLEFFVMGWFIHEKNYSGNIDVKTHTKVSLKEKE